MPLKLYAHPFSSYCQKVLTALYENGTAFEYRKLEDAESMAELAELWPCGVSRCSSTAIGPCSRRA